MLREFRGEIIVTMAVLVMGLVWWFAYVVPNTNYHYQVIGCMETAPKGLSRPAAWELCNERVLPHTSPVVRYLNR